MFKRSVDIKMLRDEISVVIMYKVEGFWGDSTKLRARLYFDRKTGAKRREATSTINYPSGGRLDDYSEADAIRNFAKSLEDAASICDVIMSIDSNTERALTAILEATSGSEVSFSGWKDTEQA